MAKSRTSRQRRARRLPLPHVEAVPRQPATHWLADHEAEREQADDALATRLKQDPAS